MCGVMTSSTASVASRKAASTVALPLSVNVHVVDVPVQPPDHDPNTDDESAVALRVTLAPCKNLFEQIVGHAISPPALDTVPAPAPDLVTVSV